MKRCVTSVLLISLTLVACRPRDESAVAVEINRLVTAPVAIIVTPTPVPTRVPTVVRVKPAAIPSATQVITPEADNRINFSAGDKCDEILKKLYTRAGDLCLSGPTGYFCNGGQASKTEPDAGSLNAPGAMADADTLDSLQTAQLGTEHGGGLIWLRLEGNIRMDALLIGQVNMQNAVRDESGIAKWQFFTIESAPAQSNCENVPETGVLIVQGLYGQTSRVVINGVSAQINGTVIVLTQGELTKFIVIEGQVVLLSFGQQVTLNVGEQLNLRYAAGDWSKALAEPGTSTLLEYDLIKDLPISLFDRPVPIPQSGYVQTQGGVNMRIAPDINAQLLFQVPAGETMSVLGISSDREWLHIRLGNGESGWMNAALLARNLGEITQVYDETPQPPQRYGELATRAFVNVGAGGNLREAPDTAFRVKQTLPYGMEVTLLARSPYSPWVKVDSGNSIGWMALFTLRTESVIASLPIDYNVPLPPRATATPSFSYGGGHAYPNPDGGY